MTRVKFIIFFLLLLFNITSVFGDSNDAAQAYLAKSYNDAYTAAAKSKDKSPAALKKVTSAIIGPAAEMMNASLNESLSDSLEKSGVKRLHSNEEAAAFLKAGASGKSHSIAPKSQPIVPRIFSRSSEEVVSPSGTSKEIVFPGDPNDEVPKPKKKHHHVSDEPSTGSSH